MATGKASGNAIKAGEAFVELNADDKQFLGVIDKVGNRFKKFGGMIKNVGLGITAIGTSIVAPLATAAFATLKYIDSIQDIADRANASTEAVSRLAYAAKLSATNIEDVEAANKKLTASAVAASNGSDEQATAFAQMKISANDFLALDMDERFVMISEALEGMEDPLERSRFMIALFGKSASTMIPLLKEGGDGLRDMFKEAESVGAVIRKEDGKKAAEAMDAFDKVLTSVKSTLVEVGLAVFSLGEDTKEGQRIVLMYLTMARDWIKENKKLVGILVIIGGVLIAVGTALTIFGIAIGAIASIVTATIGIITGLVAVLGGITVAGVLITGVVLALVAGVGYLIYAFFKFTDIGKAVGKIWTDVFKRIGDSFGIMWEGIVGALKKGDLKLVMDMLALGFLIAWHELMLGFRESWNEFLNFFLDGFTNIVSLLRISFSKFVSFVKKQGFEAVISIAKTASQIFGALGLDELTGLTKSLDDLAARVQTSIDDEVKLQVQIEKNILAEGDTTKATRKAEQDKKTAESRKNIDAWIAVLKELTRIANEPIVVAPQLPIAPMPREVGKGGVDKKLGMLGDSVKGLFDSADFAGSLAIGEASSYAKDSVDLQKKMLGELQAINTKVGLGEFT